MFPDWTREHPRHFSDPGRKLLLLTVRRYQFWRARGGLFDRLAARLSPCAIAFWSVVTGAEIPLTCQVGRGVLVAHPNGIVIRPGAKIGVNSLIFQVTLAAATAAGFPKLPAMLTPVPSPGASQGRRGSGQARRRAFPEEFTTLSDGGLGRSAFVIAKALARRRRRRSRSTNKQIGVAAVVFEIGFLGRQTAAAYFHCLIY